MALNREIVRSWVHALRSGDYPRGENALKRTLPSGGCAYCPLGVLSDLAEKAGVVVSRRDPDCLTWEYVGAVSGFRARYLLPPAVVQWVGRDVTQVDLLGTQQTIPYLNDTHGYDFGLMANLIEETYLREDTCER